MSDRHNKCPPNYSRRKFRIMPNVIITQDSVLSRDII